MTEQQTTEAGASEFELWEQQNKQAGDKLDALASSVTQREWLIITRALERTRHEIGSDTGLTLLAMAWVKEKHEHGGASWDRLLDMTDQQLEDLHGFPRGDGKDLSREPGSAKPAGEAPVE